MSATLATGNHQTIFQPEGCLTPWDNQAKRVFSIGGPGPTLSSGDGEGANIQPTVCYSIDGDIARGAHMGQNGKGWSDDGASPTISTADVPAVAFTQNQRDEVRLEGGDGQVVGAVAASPGSKNQHYVCTQYGDEVAGTLTARHDSSPCPDRGANVVCISDDTAKAAVDEELCGTLKVGGMVPSIASYSPPKYVVRRLTPVECERLQGFPDGWTDVNHKGKPAKDGPRYKAMGNSMAVPVIRWIGERIEMVDDLVTDIIMEGE